MLRAGLPLVRALAIASALFALVLGCAQPPRETSSRTSLPSWAKSPPPGCAIGLSGPTLNPGDALRYARASALTQLASGHADSAVHVESELLVSGGGQRGGEFTRQDITGGVRNVRIVAMWAEDTESTQSGGRERHVYALGCRREASAAGLTDPGVPAWVLNVPRDEVRACALGVGGPTRDPSDQPAATLRDARRALAATLESEYEAIIIDTGQRRPRVASELRTTESATARANAVTELEVDWADRHGRGPLGLKQTLYGLACTPR